MRRTTARNNSGSSHSAAFAHLGNDAARHERGRDRQLVGVPAVVSAAAAPRLSRRRADTTRCSSSSGPGAGRCPAPRQDSPGTAARAAGRTRGWRRCRAAGRARRTARRQDRAGDVAGIERLRLGEQLRAPRKPSAPTSTSAVCAEPSANRAVMPSAVCSTWRRSFQMIALATEGGAQGVFERRFQEVAVCGQARCAITSPARSSTTRRSTGTPRSWSSSRCPAPPRPRASRDAS